jgi:hypothetical protein
MAKTIPLSVDLANEAAMLRRRTLLTLERLGQADLDVAAAEAHRAALRGQAIRDGNEMRAHAQRALDSLGLAKDGPTTVDLDAWTVTVDDSR